MAAAEFKNHLQQFVDWLINASKTQSNLTTATYHGTSHLAGKKGPPRYRPSTRKNEEPESTKADSITNQQ